MTTISVWLLISLGSFADRMSRPTVVVERFATMQECQRVNDILSNGYYRQNMHQCVQATIVIGGVK